MSQKITDKTRIRADIDLDAILHNYLYTKELTNKRTICVVKADAYGHGALRIAKMLQQNGADYFAVATIDEALELRQGGINGGILILGYVFSEHIHIALQNDISLTVASIEALEAISKLADNKRAKIHIKLNTGMHRTGFDVSHDNFCPQLEGVANILLKNSNIVFEGLFSHFASAECDKNFSELQYNNYQKCADFFASFGLTPQIRHICNSSGLINYPNMLLDAVRLGITLYGCNDSTGNYKPAMQLKTRIVDIHKLSAGDYVGYGLTYKASNDITMAVISAGYGDGLPRRLSGSNAFVLCRGKRVPIIGRICMDMSMIDISGIADVKVGDEITLWGYDGNEVITCDEQAKKADTISYELLCGVSKRVPRIYNH